MTTGQSGKHAVYEYAPMPVEEYKMEERVPGVRYIVRDGQRVLQQYWSVKTFQGNSCVGMHGEWRDVPVETE